jgi:hypothetical protein
VRKKQAAADDCPSERVGLDHNHDRGRKL